MTLEVIALLALGTYAFRLAGPLLRHRIELSGSTSEWLALPAVGLLAAIVATATLYAGTEFGGWARATGVGVAAVLAAARAPFVLVVVAAAGITAVLRALGVP